MASSLFEVHTTLGSRFATGNGELAPSRCRPIWSEDHMANGNSMCSTIVPMERLQQYPSNEGEVISPESGF